MMMDNIETIQNILLLNHSNSNVDKILFISKIKYENLFSREIYNYIFDKISLMFIFLQLLGVFVTIKNKTTYMY